MSFHLQDFGIDLTAQAEAGRLDPVSCRDAEIGRVARILARKTKGNPLLLGEPGVGKTAIVEGLAQKIVAGMVPANLVGVSVFSLNLGGLLAGTTYRGDFEKRLQALVTELGRSARRRILFVDEIHLLDHAGRSDGGLDAGNLLKPLLARGALPCIGASTTPEWKEAVRRDPALERRFQPVLVAEPTAAQTLHILELLRPRFEQHHGVEIADVALEAAVETAPSVYPHRRYPDSAIDLIDEACAMQRQAGCCMTGAQWVVAEQQLAAAEYVFDLERCAMLRSRVLPALAVKQRPRLDAAAVLRAIPGATSAGPG